MVLEGLGAGKENNNNKNPPLSILSQKVNSCSKPAPKLLQGQPRKKVGAGLHIVLIGWYWASASLCFLIVLTEKLNVIVFEENFLFGAFNLHLIQRAFSDPLWERS